MMTRLACQGGRRFARCSRRSQRPDAMSELTPGPRYRDLNARSAERKKKPQQSIRNPTFEQLGGAWDHSSLHTTIFVTGNEVQIDKGRYSLIASGGKIEMEGWLLQSYTDDEVVWKARGGSQKCSWYRRSVAPKRERKQSLVQAEADRDHDIVARALTSPLMRRAPPKPPKVETEEEVEEEEEIEEPEAVEEFVSPPEPKIVREVTISDAELRRLNKQLKRKEKAWNKKMEKEAEKGCGLSKQKIDADLADEMSDLPDPLQLTPHDPKEWANWKRLDPHTLPYGVMEHLAKQDFPIGETKNNKHHSPSKLHKLSLETLARSAPVLTEKTARWQLKRTLSS